MPTLRDKIDRVLMRDDFLRKLLIVTAALLWLAPVFSSFWRDEAITFWIIKDGWSEAWRRALGYQEWSAIYFMLLKAWGAVFGMSEVSLRLPSAISQAGAAYGLYLLGKKLRNAETGLLAALVFAASNSMFFYASEARPYAAATAFAVFSMLYLVKTLDGGRAKDAALYALFSVLAACMQLLFAGILLIHFLYWGYRRFSERTAASGLFLFSFSAVILLLAPLAGPAAALAQRAPQLMFAPAPGLLDFAGYLAGFPLIAGLAAGLLAAGPFSIDKESFKRIPVSGFVLLACWALLPPLLFFSISKLASAKLWVTRYFLYSQAGSALCVGLGLGLIEPARTIRLAAAAIAAAGLAAHLRFSHFNEDWRSAALAAGDWAAGHNAAVALTSPYIESMQPAWLSDAEKAAYLAAPLSCYPAAGTPAVLPLELLPGNQRLVTGLLKSAAGGRDGMAVVSLGNRPYDEFIAKCLAAEGFPVRNALPGLKNPSVTIYSRR